MCVTEYVADCTAQLAHSIDWLALAHVLGQCEIIRTYIVLNENIYCDLWTCTHAHLTTLASRIMTKYKMLKTMFKRVLCLRECPRAYRFLLLYVRTRSWLVWSCACGFVLNRCGRGRRLRTSTRRYAPKSVGERPEPNQSAWNGFSEAMQHELCFTHCEYGGSAERIIVQTVGNKSHGTIVPRLLKLSKKS